MNANFSLKHSEQINEIATALAKAQGEMKPAIFNRVNPHYKSRYADFTSCMDACRLPLSKNGLAVAQLPTFSTDGRFILSTLLLHSSGQWMACEFPMNTKTDNIQSIGSAMSYAKRYSLCGMLGIVADEDIDDDGESACISSKDEVKSNPPATPLAKKLAPQQVEILKNLEKKLDKVCLAKIDTWLNSAYKTTIHADLPIECFTKVLGAYENAVKYMETEKLELAHA